MLFNPVGTPLDWLGLRAFAHVRLACTSFKVNIIIISQHVEQ